MVPACGRFQWGIRKKSRHGKVTGPIKFRVRCMVFRGYWYDNKMVCGRTVVTGLGLGLVLHRTGNRDQGFG
jgi:hypothetical protein